MYKVVKVCQPELLQKYYSECKENNLKYPDLVRWIPSDYEFELYIIDQSGNHWSADQFFYANQEIELFTTNETNGLREIGEY